MAIRTIAYMGTLMQLARRQGQLSLALDEARDAGAPQETIDRLTKEHTEAVRNREWYENIVLNADEVIAPIPTGSANP